MKSYLDFIEHKIELQYKNSSQLALIRLEGFNSPEIYKNICSYFKNTKNVILKAKLSKEKFEEFKEFNTVKSKEALDFLEKNNYVDLDGAMTRWRNESTEEILINSDYKQLMLLMGTESVSDKGGLADFYSISPETILNELKKDYSIWFKDLILDNNLDENILKSIKTFLKVLFTNINVDLFQLSNLIDYLESLKFYSGDEIIQEMCFTLYKFWGIPSIKTDKKIPKLSSLKKGTLKSADILTKSFNFITRLQFKKGITKTNREKIEHKIDKYAMDFNIDLNSPFPTDKSIFSNYKEFKECLIKFIDGENYHELKNKFLDMDFGIIDSILNLKVESTKNTIIKDKTEKILGEPLEVYIKMICSACIEFKNSYKDLPDNIVIKINNIKLSNCSTEEEKDSYFDMLSKYLGGIVDYLNIESEILNKDINIMYENKIDPFKSLEQLGIEVVKSSKINDLSKIDLTIYVKSISENEKIKKEYSYFFNPNDAWLQDFSLLSIEKLFEPSTGYIKLPLYAESNNIQDFISCESDEEFYIKLPKINLEFNYESYQNLLNDKFNINNIQNHLGLLLNDYKEFLINLLKNGYFSTIKNSSCCNNVFVKYSKLLQSIRENYNLLTSTQMENVHLLLNMFLIGDVDFEHFKVNKIKSVLMSPYHPIILEKTFYKMDYLKKSFEEMLILINNDTISNKEKLNSRLNYYYKMCLITSGFDVYCFGNKQLMLAKKIHGRYSIYSSKQFTYNMVSEKVFASDLIDDEEVDKKALIKKNHKSSVIAKNILDYIKTFPSTIDGINIIFINPDDMQHIVSGIHEAVEVLKENLSHININVRILISDTRKNGCDYLKYWLDNCFEDDNKINIKTYLNYVDFNSTKLKENIKKYLINQDLGFIYEVLEEMEIDFQITNGNNKYNELKYPAIFIPLPIAETQENRLIDISQRQFITSNAHLQLIHKYLRPNEVEAIYRVNKNLKINDKKKSLIDYIHENCKWVVCLDETIDKNIINSNKSKIIGFSTGQGIFGELNTTISAREDIVIDIEKRLKSRLLYTFNKWQNDIAEKAANYCIEMGKNLDGLKMLKALNPSDYEIHNYLAYILTMQNMNMNLVDEKYITRVLINLDNYLHWFNDKLSFEDNRIDNTRPDFLILDIEKNNELFDENIPLKIKATIIECKMGKENSAYIDEAINQIQNGIKILASNFSPLSKSVNKRYWYNQLYRTLVFSKLNIKDNEEGYSIISNKLTDIYEGNFEIEWNAQVYAYWLNRQDSVMTSQLKKLSEKCDNMISKVEIFESGQLYIQKALLPKEYDNFNFVFNEIENESNKEDDFNKEVLENNLNLEDIKETSELIFIKDTNLDKKVNKTKDLINNNFLVDENSNDICIDNIQENKILHENKKKDFKNMNYKVNESCENIINSTEEHIRFLLGEDIRTKEKIYWEYTHKELNNRHLLINGNSGSGKTYCIQTLILEATKNNISVVVFDYTDGFTKSKLSSTLLKHLGENFEERYVKYEKFPINPFKKSIISYNGKEFLEPDVDVANRIASSFAKIYSSLGDQQRNSIYSSIMSGIKKYGDNMDLGKLYDELEEEDSTYAKTTMTKIRPLIDYNPFEAKSHFSWKDIVNSKGKMYVIQLSGFDREIQLILTDLILWDIWNYAVREGDENTPLPIVLDEAQNLSHDENSPSGKILAEGRKFGLSGWYATQFMKGRLNSGEIGNLQQSAQKLYFSPPEESIKEVAKSIDITTEGTKSWSEKLSKLTKGVCVTSGFKVNGDRFDKYDPKIIKITSLEERVQNE